MNPIDGDPIEPVERPDARDPDDIMSMTNEELIAYLDKLLGTKTETG